jgi:Tol biopolymer transport system component
VTSIAWHPDGQRVSFWGTTPPPSVRRFWTIAISGGTPSPSERADRVARQPTEAAVSLGRFRWGPAGDVLYFEGSSQQLANLWKVTVDPRTLRWVGGPERLTTGFARDSNLAISADGRRLVYAARQETVRAWSFPFDASTGRVTASGEPVTAANISTFGLDLSPDGRKLVFVARRQGKQKVELWQKFLEDGREVLLGEADNYFAPRWSRDGRRVAYRREIFRNGQIEGRIGWMPSDDGDEQLLPAGPRHPYDWSADGNWLLHNCAPPAKLASLCASPVNPGVEPRTILIDADYSVWQGRFSPNGRWISFNAQSNEPGVSLVGVVPADGGKWIRVTEAFWADKPRWSPDGTTLYFISNRQGPFFNVWGIRFDPKSGTPIGEPFRVTSHDSPDRVIAAAGPTEIALSDKRLVLPIREVSGNIWMLDNVNR